MNKSIKEANKELIALLESWIIEQPTEDDPDIEEQMRELDVGRHSNQSLFSE